MDRDAEMEGVAGDAPPRRGRDESRERRGDDSRERRRDGSRDRSRDRRGDVGREEVRSSRDQRHRSRSRDRSPRRSSHRHRSRSHSRDRRDDRDRRYRSRSRSRSPHRGGGGGGGGHRFTHRGPPPPMARPTGPINAPHEEAEAHAKVSIKENRVYVGNLPYNCTYRDLWDFMSEAGEVAFAEIFTTPVGQSKGCGIVEFVTKEGAERSIAEMTQKELLGRPVFVREDREPEAKFGVPHTAGHMGHMGPGGPGGPMPFGGFRGGFRGRGGFMGGPPPHMAEFRQLFIGGLPPQATWQDMKDLFREAGPVIRADVQSYPDGTPKGTGIVVYEDHQSAKNAIEMYNGYQWGETVLQVRPDRFAMSTPFAARGGMFPFRGGFAPRGAPFMANRGGFMPRGGFMNGGGMMAGGGRGGRTFTNDLYADYNGPEAGVGGHGAGMDAILPAATPAEPSTQIMVRNLPWSTSNEDLVELFETTGQVVLAEILFDGTRSKGMGVVQFKDVGEAEQACAKFTGYMYGGRPLVVQFNDRWHHFADTAAAGGTAPVA